MGMVSFNMTVSIFISLAVTVQVSVPLRCIFDEAPHSDFHILMLDMPRLTTDSPRCRWFSLKPHVYHGHLEMKKIFFSLI